MKKLIALTVCAALFGCGGGSGSGSSATPTPTPTPSGQHPIDPFTGASVTGTTVTTISGVVMSTPVVGATVTAYLVNSDGTNGASLGVTSAPTGADGKFILSMTQAPSGIFRLVATGGYFMSSVDASKQPNVSMELLAPYASTDYNFFVITPITHVASQVATLKATKGETLTQALIDGSTASIGLGVGNLILKNDLTGREDKYKTVPGSAADDLFAYKDVLAAMEGFGVKFDLPSSEVLRIASLSAQGGYQFDGIDGNGAPIMAGTWASGIFSNTSTILLDLLMADRNPDGTVVMFNGKPVHDSVQNVVAYDRMRGAYHYASCLNSAARPAYTLRYPVESATFDANPTFETLACQTEAAEAQSMTAKLTTNNRSKMN